MASMQLPPSLDREQKTDNRGVVLLQPAEFPRPRKVTVPAYDVPRHLAMGFRYPQQASIPVAASAEDIDAQIAQLVARKAELAASEAKSTETATRQPAPEPKTGKAAVPGGAAVRMKANRDQLVAWAQEYGIQTDLSWSKSAISDAIGEAQKADSGS